MRPDLSLEHRTVRNKLCALRQEIESTSDNAKCALKSWRYLAVSHLSGSSVYYEADCTSPPQLMDVKFIPVKFRTPPLCTPQRHQSQPRIQPQCSTSRSANSTLASSCRNIQQTPATFSTNNKLQKKIESDDSAIDIDTSFISASL